MQPPLDRPLRIAVLISGGGSTLANIIQHLREGALRNIQITRVISSRSNVRGVTIAREAGIPIAIVRKRDFKDDHAFSDAITAAFESDPADLIVMGGFLCFWHIPPTYRARVVNIHPALLPEFGGRGMFGHHVHAAILAAGRTESGCTVHLVDNQYDHGPIIAQSRVPVLPDDTTATLAERVGQAERELYPQVLQEIADHGLAWLKKNYWDPQHAPPDKTLPPC